MVKLNNSSPVNDKISEKDVLSALQNLEILGTGIKIINNEYISTSPFALSGDVDSIL